MKKFEDLIAIIGSVFFIIIGSVIAYILDFWPFTIIWIIIAVLFILLVLNAPSSNTKMSTPAKKTSNSPLSKTINNDLRIMNDCLKFINTSANIQTVINRYDDLLNVLSRLVLHEKNPCVDFPRELPSQALIRIRSEKSQIMIRAIQRSYDDMLNKCSTLKTEKGRINRKQKFFDELKALMPYFSIETRNFAIELINQNKNNSLTELKEILDSEIQFSVEDNIEGDNK